MQQRPIIRPGSTHRRRWTKVSSARWRRLFGDLDTVELMVGSYIPLLRNPNGFDLQSGVYVDGLEPSSVGGFLSPTLALSMYSDIGDRSYLRRRFSASVDSSNFDGLSMDSLVGDAGVSLVQRLGPLGVSVGLSAGTGITHSQSYHDSANHSLAEASAPRAGIAVAGFSGMEELRAS